MRVDIARMIENAPKQSGASGASAPPASMASASSRTIARNASPTAIVPDAQLIPLVEFGPQTPNSIATLQLAAPAFACPHEEGAAPKTADKAKDEKGQDKAKEAPKTEKAPDTAKAKEQPKDTKKTDKVSQK